MQQARKVEVEVEVEEENISLELEKLERALEGYGGVDTSWIPNYSMKVQGCSHVTDWNWDNEDNADNSKLTTKRLLKFRLCPSDSCDSATALGCSGKSKYGDYVVDLDIFLITYLDWLQQDLQDKCQQFAWETCKCYDDGSKDDNFNQDQCEFQCWYKKGKSECYTDYTQDDDGSGFQLDNYMECSPWYPPGYNGKKNNNNRRLKNKIKSKSKSKSKFNKLSRKLEEDAQDDVNQAQDDQAQDDQEYEEEYEEDYEDEEEEEEEETYVEQEYLVASNDRVYYMGPHCADSSNVYIGLFVDDTCTKFADNYGGAKSYKILTGTDLPYSGNTPLVHKNCMSCVAETDDMYNYNYGNDVASELCTNTYSSAGKCENRLSGVVNDPNEAACNFIHGINYIEQFSKGFRFNPFTFFFSFVDDAPETYVIAFAAIFGAAVCYALYMKYRLIQTLQDRIKSKEIAFSAAQVESHYTDVKVKDAFLAM